MQFISHDKEIDENTTVVAFNEYEGKYQIVHFSSNRVLHLNDQNLGLLYSGDVIVSGSIIWIFSGGALFKTNWKNWTTLVASKNFIGNHGYLSSVINSSDIIFLGSDFKNFHICGKTGKATEFDYRGSGGSGWFSKSGFFVSEYDRNIIVGKTKNKKCWDLVDKQYRYPSLHLNQVLVDEDVFVLVEKCFPDGLRAEYYRISEDLSISFLREVRFSGEYVSLFPSKDYLLILTKNGLIKTDGSDYINFDISEFGESLDLWASDDGLVCSVLTNKGIVKIDLG